MSRESIYKKVAEELKIPEEVIEKVISWSYKKANEAVKTNNEIELSGLGKLMVSNRKLNKTIEKEESKFRVFSKMPDREMMLEDCKKKLADLKKKKDELSGNSGGMEEHILPTKGTEGVDKQNS